MTKSERYIEERSRGAHVKVCVLTELEGLPWDDPVVRAMVSTVHPEWIRVQMPNSLMHTDSRSGRVTVHLTKERRVARIVQEAMVWFPDDVPMTVACGWDVDKHLRILREKFPPDIQLSADELRQAADVPDLHQIVDSVLSDNPILVHRYHEDSKVLQVLVGMCVQLADCKLNPKLIRERIKETLNDHS